MKRLAIAVIVLGVILGGIALTKDKGVDYKAPTEVIKEVEKTVPELDKRIADALVASSTDIERAMQEASEKAKTSIEAEIKLRVNRQLQKELEIEESKLEEQVSL